MCFKAIIRPAVTYACETRILRKEDQKKLEVWERKLLWKVFGGIKEEDEYRRTNNELKELYKETNIVQYGWMDI
jgi:hypothetical protein